MEISIKKFEDVSIAELDGEVDASTAPVVEAKVLPLTEENGKLLLDMTKVSYMSSAGLRVLLSLYRQAIAKGCKVVLVGLTEDLRDTMFVTGFLEFFIARETIDLGLEALA